MKKIIFSILFLVLIFSSTNAQGFKLYTSRVDSGTNLSNAAITLEDGYWLKAIYFPTMKANTTSFKLLVYNYATAAYDTLWYDSEVYNPTISRAGSPTSLSANAVWGIQKFKILLPVSQDSNTDIKIVAIKPS